MTGNRTTKSALVCIAAEVTDFTGDGGTHNYTFTFMSELGEVKMTSPNRDEFKIGEQYEMSITPVY